MQKIKRGIRFTDTPWHNENAVFIAFLNRAFA